uniref:Uncharacterized protein n=1 Tax=Anguilla anguilla TaxID=7936 RepID=A0A0E9VMW5_ANGAN
MFQITRQIKHKSRKKLYHLTPSHYKIFFVVFLFFIFRFLLPKET